MTETRKYRGWGWIVDVTGKLERLRDGSPLVTTGEVAIKGRECVEVEVTETVRVIPQRKRRGT